MVTWYYHACVRDRDFVSASCDIISCCSHTTNVLDDTVSVPVNSAVLCCVVSVLYSWLFMCKCNTKQMHYQHQQRQQQPYQSASRPTLATMLQYDDTIVYIVMVTGCYPFIAQYVKY